MDVSRIDLVTMVARIAIAALASYYAMKMAVNIMDPSVRQKATAAKKARELLKKLGVDNNTNLNEYEYIIASQLVVGDSLTTTWADVAGLQPIIKELRETVILPIQQSRRHRSSLITPPKGVLLHGPPGCGKTLLARAVAKEAGCRFINLDVSALTDKWYGESQKLASAVFSLANKIKPCIIFIDEIDSFLRVRNSSDHEATAMIKAQFLQNWDGLSTDHNSNVLVMAATNRPHDVDRAILRRLPAAFHIQLPGEPEREMILRLVLKDDEVGPCVDVPALAAMTSDFSGSDLRELCRNAAVYRLRSLYDEMDDDASYHNASETVQTVHWDPDSDSTFSDTPLRPIIMTDFIQALKKIRAARVLDLSAASLRKIDLD